MEHKTENYFIAYFDILGYKEYFEDKDNDINEFLNSIINLVNDILNRTTKNTRIFNHQFISKMFSDNFVILVKNNQNIGDYNIIRVLSHSLALLQLLFLEKYKIIIRGGITKGDVYVDNQLIFGEGLIRAVDRETYANFPRVIIDSERIDKGVCDDLCKKYYIAKDDDEEYYINFWEVLEDGVLNDDNSIGSIKTRLDLIRKNIITLVKKYGKYKRNVKDKYKIQIAEKTISKYAWLLSKYNAYCDGNYEKWKIPYTLTLYHRLMKCEINV